MPALYVISDIFYLILTTVAPYRRKVVIQNLKNSFPQKSPTEIKKLTQDFYHHLCDLIVESIKSFSISESEINKRMVAKNPEIFEPYLKKNQTVVVGGGHNGNWEWFGVQISLQVPLQCFAIYKPLSNNFLETKMKITRSRFGLTMVPIPDVPRWFSLLPTKASLMIFGSDQSPGSPTKSHWIKFLNQDTPAVFGCEKYARENNLPVFFGVIRKVKRGFYEYEFSLITDFPATHPPGWITEEINRRLESEIIRDPRYWLWSHRRWKHRKPN